MLQHPSADALPASLRWRIVLLLVGYAALGHFNRIAISVAGSEVFIKHLGISETEMGWVYTTFLIVYTLCMLFLHLAYCIYLAILVAAIS